MNEGRTVFAQLMDHVPHHLFTRCVAAYQGGHRAAVRQTRIHTVDDRRGLSAPPPR